MKPFDEVTLDEKLDEVANGNEVAFSQEEAELLGALEETAIPLKEAEQSRYSGGVFTSINETLEPPKHYTK